MNGQSGLSNIIALLTDFGSRDHYVGAVRGAVLSINPAAVLADITHEINPHDIRSAGFSLWACYRDFPPGTVFLCVVDPGVGSARRRIILRTRRFQFVAPDNGLLSFILREERQGKAFKIVNSECFGPDVTGTFDGRDVFGPVAAHLANGIPAERIGIPIDDPFSFRTGLETVREGHSAISEVVHIDRFGNLVTGLDSALLVKGAEAEIRGVRIDKTGSHFSEWAPGELFLIRGSSGLLEIVSDKMPAADLLSASVGEPVVLRLPESRFDQ
jgi:S-adenosylmethionine hydrolase